MGGCPNRTSFVFALVVSKRQATLGLQATRTPPDLSRFALSVSCRPADLLIKQANNGQECSNAGKKALRTRQTRNLGEHKPRRTPYVLRCAGATDARGRRPSITGRTPEGNPPLPIETASPKRSPGDGPCVTRPHPLPACWLSDGLRILLRVGRGNPLGHFEVGYTPKRVTILLLRGWMSGILYWGYTEQIAWGTRRDFHSHVN
jgi:hypothetical protein